MKKVEQFIQENTRNTYNYNSYEQDPTPWLTPDDARKAVEITKEEMTEKACEYLDGLVELLNDHGHRLKKERIIDGLKQAMEEVLK